MNAIRCTPHFKSVDTAVSIAALTRIVSRQPRSAILGGNSAVERFSIFAANPVTTDSFCERQGDPLRWLEQTLNRYQLTAPDNHPMQEIACPGWIGYFSYDLGRYIERIPALAKDDLQMPLIDLVFYDAMIVYDHRSNQIWLTAVEFDGQQESLNQKFARLEQWIVQAQDLILELPASGQPLSNNDYRSFAVNLSRQEYFASLDKIHRHILDGDVYQINFSQRFACPFDADPALLFVWQNTYNPSPYAAYLKADNWAIVSASPELFLHIDGREILTRPIKGTRPRKPCECNTETKEANRRHYQELLDSDKDKAELAMIVDLERNDLARVCIPGSRHVRRRRIIEAYPTVFHAFGEVAGTLPRDNDPSLFCDVLRAIFPGGSITGAPKIRAMEIIEQLEPTRRGVYCGSIGHIGLNFRAVLNIAIRTIVVKDRLAFVQTGGGVVADSDPQAEWDETLTKADALLKGVQACQTAHLKGDFST
jgi:para-aminobenzoate synthetase component 1